VNRAFSEDSRAEVTDRPVRDEDELVTEDDGILIEPHRTVRPHLELVSAGMGEDVEILSADQWHSFQWLNMSSPLSGLTLVCGSEPVLHDQEHRTL